MMIEGTFTRSNGKTSRFLINPNGTWTQWGADLGETVDLVAAMTSGLAAESSYFMQDEDATTTSDLPEEAPVEGEVVEALPAEPFRGPGTEYYKTLTLTASDYGYHFYGKAEDKLTNDEMDNCIEQAHLLLRIAPTLLSTEERERLGV